MENTCYYTKIYYLFISQILLHNIKNEQLYLQLKLMLIVVTLFSG